MKLKCKIFINTLFALTVVFANLNVQAQHPVKHPIAKKKAIQHQNAAAHPKGEMVHAINVFKRTNKVILIANNKVKENKVYTGDLAKAVHHQRYAKKLLKMHKAHRAMQHSRVARNYAFRAIRSNKGVVDKELVFTDEENKTMGENVADAELEKELKDSEPNVSYKDEGISNKDMTEIEVLETDEADYKNE